MLNNLSIDAVNGSNFRETLRKPLYESYCFSKIPDTIKKLLGVRSVDPLPADCIKTSEIYEDVILFFIDGFGWVFLEKNQGSQPFLQRTFEKGIVSKITSQFPSTTACHVTTMNTGLPVAKTGIYEWFYYEPKVDDVIAPFLFSFAGDKHSGSLEKTGIPPEEIYPFSTFYE
ncbi:MAG: phosphodiesterase, partial [Chlamydiae bacterium]|nr:phosphodiesterase [Chlamydiota bacterium]